MATTRTVSRAALDELTGATSSSPVLSLYLRTDPRDPANTAADQGWLVTARNQLRAIGTRLEETAPRDDRLAFRALAGRVLDTLAGLSPHELARTLAWFVSLDGALDRRYVLHLPVAEQIVRLDAGPYVAPLVDLAERGKPTGVILASVEHVRMLTWADGALEEADDTALEVDPSRWRPYRGASRPGPGARAANHTEHFEARIEDHRERFLSAAARRCAELADELGWRRIVLIGEAAVGARLRRALPPELADRIVLELDRNLVAEPAGQLVKGLEPQLEALHRAAATSLAERLESNGAAIGPGAVLMALAEGRVAHLVLDPDHVPDPRPAGPAVDEMLHGAPPDLIGERAVEAALASDAAVTVLPAIDSEPLERADGMIAKLRW